MQRNKSSAGAVMIQVNGKMVTLVGTATGYDAIVKALGDKPENYGPAGLESLAKVGETLTVHECKDLQTALVLMASSTEKIAIKHNGITFVPTNVGDLVLAGGGDMSDTGLARAARSDKFRRIGNVWTPKTAAEVLYKLANSRE